jgi:RNA polymerase sigma factor (sigma-70 family)
MGTTGLALPWETRISSVPRERENRVETSEDLPSHASQSAAPGATTQASSEDAELAERCRSGDLGGYERLYALHGARMKNVARNLLGNPVDAEDAVQETFLKVQRSITGFRGQSSFVTWTYRILINTCYDARRSRMRKKEVVNDDSEDSPRAEPRAPGADGAGTGAGWLDEASTRRFLAIRSRRIPSCRNCRDAGDYRDGFEEHTFSGEEKSSASA